MISRHDVEEGSRPSSFTVPASPLLVFVVMRPTMVMVELLFVDLILAKRVFVARTVIVDDVALAWVLQNGMIPS